MDSTPRLLVSETPVLRPGRRLDFFTLTGDQPCGQVPLHVAYVPWAVERCPGLEASAPGGCFGHDDPPKEEGSRRGYAVQRFESNSLSRGIFSLSLFRNL